MNTFFNFPKFGQLFSAFWKGGLLGLCLALGWASTALAQGGFGGYTITYTEAWSGGTDVADVRYLYTDAQQRNAYAYKPDQDHYDFLRKVRVNFGQQFKYSTQARRAGVEPIFEPRSQSANRNAISPQMFFAPQSSTSPATFSQRNLMPQLRDNRNPNPAPAYLPHEGPASILPSPGLATDPHPLDIIYTTTTPRPSEPAKNPADFHLSKGGEYPTSLDPAAFRLPPEGPRSRPITILGHEPLMPGEQPDSSYHDPYVER